MGVYCYTRRSEVRTIGDRRIGRFAFAYKESFWNDRGPYARMTAQKHAMAEIATQKTASVNFFIVGEFSDIKETTPRYDYPVYEVKPGVSCFMDTRALSPVIVGYLIRRGRSLDFVDIETAQAEQFQVFANSQRLGFIKPWKAYSMLGQIRQHKEHDDAEFITNESRFKAWVENCLRMEGFVDDGIDAISDYLRAKFA